MNQKEFETAADAIFADFLQGMIKSGNLHVYDGVDDETAADVMRMVNGISGGEYVNLRVDPHAMDVDVLPRGKDMVVACLLKYEPDSVSLPEARRDVLHIRCPGPRIVYGLKLPRRATAVAEWSYRNGVLSALIR